MLPASTAALQPTAEEQPPAPAQPSLPAPPPVSVPPPAPDVTAALAPLAPALDALDLDSPEVQLAAGVHAGSFHAGYLQQPEQDVHAFDFLEVWVLPGP